MAREIDVATYSEVTSTLYKLLIEESKNIYKLRIFYFIGTMRLKNTIIV